MNTGKTHFKKGHIVTKGMRKKIGLSKMGNKNPQWKGGKQKTTYGYINLSVPNHPNASKRGVVRRHRLVMEKKIGRYLRPNEVVHHINGVPGDDRPENLYLFSNQGKHRLYEMNIMRTYFKWIRVEKFHI